MANHDITADEVAKRFATHPPEGDAIETHADVRGAFTEFATDLLQDLPAGREKSLAYTALEEASFWAHAAIAREGK